MPFPQPVALSQLPDSGAWDALIIVAETPADVDHNSFVEAFEQLRKIDQRIASQTSLIASEHAPGGRFIFAPTGPLNRDFDDVRRFAEAAGKAAKLARDAGASHPIFMAVAPKEDKYSQALASCYLGACQALWQPLEARQDLEFEVEPVTEVGLVGADAALQQWLMSLEAGRRLARDLCGTEPERMAPPGFADYCVAAFKDTAVQVEVLADQDLITQDYPLLAAVARAAREVERHQARVIRLVYQPEGTIEREVYLAGKGVTYDTGGADLKVGGHMAGMSRDKGGAAAVAGFMLTLAKQQPKGLKVVAEIGAVRNSIGAEAFVPDEIIVGHAGVRVRIGNTDAEGRLVLADLLSHLRVAAKDAKQPEFYSVATLTGHAARALGPYTALVENGLAYQSGCGASLVDAGEHWGDPAERSRSRREDYDFVAPQTLADDLLSSNNAASAVTARGHQFPMAFLDIASGLYEQDNMAYTHVDIAGSGVEGGDWQHGKPTAAAVTMLAAHYLQG